jgi:hypothetical protein
VQPTDHSVRSVFVFLGETRGPETRSEHVPRDKHQGLVGIPMKHRLIQIAISLGTVASLALAGGASIKGW